MDKINKLKISKLFMVAKEYQLKIGIICGGPSSEREVSIKSARNVAKHLDADKYCFEIIEITKQGLVKIRNKLCHPSVFFKQINCKKSKLRFYDLIFIALHGKFGEDGQIQTLFEILGVPYTFSGPLASALGMNKIMTDKLVSQYKIKVPAKVILNRNSDLDNIEKIAASQFNFPWVVKPNKSGSSRAITIAVDSDDLTKAIARAFLEDDEVIVQEYINGRELTCGIFGNRHDADLEALPVVEIKTSRGFFDYQAKYLDKNTQEICPAPISPALTAKVQKQSQIVHRLLGCDGLTRSDFILTKNNQLYFLEINTIPGLTEASLCPKEALAAGYTYAEFLDKIIYLAMKKFKN